MSFNLVDIISKFVPVKILGSDNNFFANISATTTQQALTIPFSTREITVINDGGDNLNFLFGTVTNTTYPLTDAAWQYTGTWADSTVSGIPSKYTSNTANNAILKPNQVGINSIILGVVMGTGSGIAKIEISTDNGNTWVNPSSILGVTRNDGAVGTALDTFDLYTNASALNANVTYNFPYSATNIYAMRVTPTGTRNASSVNNTIFVTASSIATGGGSTYTLKSGETLGIGTKITQINVYSPTSTTGRVIAI